VVVTACDLLLGDLSNHRLSRQHEARNGTCILQR
jgi:hypothetical protein